MTAPRHPIPDAALAQHVAVLAMTGAGKSYLCQGIVEMLVARGDRACIVDPTGRYWGLRSSANGKAKGLPMIIFGGKHADVPLSQNHGAALAEIVGRTATQAIIDTRMLTVTQRTVFFRDFAEALLRLNDAPLHLIVDEAHLFAPKGRVNSPAAGEMLSAANNLISLGRGAGLKIMVVTQRPAKLHNDVLSQCQTLVAMRMGHPRDREAVAEWVDEVADRTQAADMMRSLPRLQTGTGWLWAPTLDVFTQFAAPEITTFDSGAPGAESAGAALTTVDLPTINARMAAIVEEAKANDPKFLKAEVDRLKRELAAKIRTPTPTADALGEAHDAGRAKGYAEGLADAATEFLPEVKALRASANAAAALADSAASFTAEARSIANVVEAWSKRTAERPRDMPKLTQSGSKSGPKAVISAAPSVPATSRDMPKSAQAGNSTLNRGQHAIMAAIGFFRTLGVAAPAKEALAFIAGASPTSSTYTNNLGSLRSAGLIDYPSPGTVAPTEAGEPYVGTVNMTADEVQGMVRARLSRSQVALFDRLLDGMRWDKEVLAGAVGASHTSSTFTNNLGAMRSAGIITYPAPGIVQIAPIIRLEV